MEKNRVEAFSDGVFAIVITLLILDIKFSATSYNDLPQELWTMMPRLSSYLLSFTVIGLYWVGHHYYFKFIKKVNNVFLWLNLILLLLVSLLSIPTALLGRFPFETISTFLYGINLLALNSFGLVILSYISRHPELASEQYSKAVFKRYIGYYVIINGAYIIAIALSFVAPVVSYIIYILILILAIKIYALRET